jgi:hypothetical protein
MSPSPSSEAINEKEKLPMKKLLVLAAALAGAALLAPRPVWATNILFDGGEDISFTLIGSTSINSGSQYRSSFARYGIGPVSNASTADPPAARIQTPTFTAGATVWVHAQFFNGSGSNAGLRMRRESSCEAPTASHASSSGRREPAGS